jgi:hypothetical protein
MGLATAEEAIPASADAGVNATLPYYKEYLRDDLAAVMTACGFEVEYSAPHLVSKVVVERKPLRPWSRREAGTRGNA